MKAIAIKNFGEPNVFQTIDLPMPSVSPNSVLIKVLATSINPVDLKIRQGAVTNIAPDFPAVLHGDVAGIVEAVGDEVTKMKSSGGQHDEGTSLRPFKIGDEVYACGGGVKGTGGALAEYMVADAELVARKPKSLSMTQAAALPLVSITAWEGLIDRAKVQPNHKVLIYGGTGGVGHIAVQLAKWAGAKVYATVSSDRKAAIALNLGADVAINYRQTSVEEFVAEHTDGNGFDLVFDTVGNDNLQNAFQAAKLNGTVVSTVSLSQQDLTLLHAKGLSLHLVYMLIPMLFNTNRFYHGEILAKLADLVDEGQVRPLLDAKSFTFTDVAAAHTYLESGQALGKVVLKQSLR